MFLPVDMKMRLSLLKALPDFLPKEGREELVPGSVYQLPGAFAIPVAFNPWTHARRQASQTSKWKIRKVK